MSAIENADSDFVGVLLHPLEGVARGARVFARYAPMKLSDIFEVVAYANRRECREKFIEIFFGFRKFLQVEKKFDLATAKSSLENRPGIP